MSFSAHSAGLLMDQDVSLFLMAPATLNSMTAQLARGDAGERVRVGATQSSSNKKGRS